MHVDEFLSRLQNVRPQGEGRWMASCPSHADRYPSLSIAVANGKTLLHCFAGCETSEVLAALGLCLADIRGNGTSSAPRSASGRPEDPEEELDGLTDLGNARRFRRLISDHKASHGPLARYVTPWGRWLLWQGNRWAEDLEDGIVELAAAVPPEILLEASRCRDKDRRKLLTAWAAKTESARGLKDLLYLAARQPGIPILPEKLDTDPWILAVENGVIDLRTGKLREASPADLITKSAGVRFDPEAKCPRWERFVLEIMGGSEELAAFLQRAAGYCLTGDCRERCLFILHGGGRNGKSTLLETLHRVLGDYAGKTHVETILTRRGDSTVPNDIARLRGLRFVFAAESAEGRSLNESVVKDLTGRETVTARFLFKEWFQFVPEFKLWLGTNSKPEIRGADDAIWDRLRLVPFKVRFGEGGQLPEDKELPQKLEGELPGILAWAVRGCLAWQREGLSPPEDVRLATATYRSESDLLEEFLETRCLVCREGSVGASDLYRAYKLWAADQGTDVLSQTAFGARMGARGSFTKTKDGGGRIRWCGLVLRSE